MSLHGKGEELRKDVTTAFTNVDIKMLETKYGKEISEILFREFMLPILENKDLQVRKNLVSKLDLLCAAFYEPI